MVRHRKILREHRGGQPFFRRQLSGRDGLPCHGLLRRQPQKNERAVPDHGVCHTGVTIYRLEQRAAALIRCSSGESALGGKQRERSCHKNLTENCTDSHGWNKIVAGARAEAGCHLSNFASPVLKSAAFSSCFFSSRYSVPRGSCPSIAAHATSPRQAARRLRR